MWIEKDGAAERAVIERCRERIEALNKQEQNDYNVGKIAAYSSLVELFGDDATSAPEAAGEES